MNNIITNYKNGNCSVKLFDDGTKIRSWEDEAQPEFPDSIDLKITNYCDAGCPHCHEMSTKRGKHANVESVMRIIDKLPAGCEVAIGGGNPFSHPNFNIILQEFSDRGLIANVTVNSFHVGELLEKINDLRSRKLIYGLGISYNPKYHNNVCRAVDSNTIIHVIAGVDRIWDVLSFPREWKLLVLGYKHFGFGKRYAEKMPVNNALDEWKYWIRSLMRNYHVSFDNLALKQMDIRSLLLEKDWDSLYMGDDGQFTMYADAVNEEFAVSSTSSTRYPVENDIKDMFKTVREKRNIVLI